jgi:ATP-dependent Clp protease ATP-binding subunit ClpA
MESVSKSWKSVIMPYDRSPYLKHRFIQIMNAASKAGSLLPNLMVTLLPELKEREEFKYLEPLDIIASLPAFTEADALEVIAQIEQDQAAYEKLKREYLSINPFLVDIPPLAAASEDEDSSNAATAKPQGQLIDKELVFTNICNDLIGQDSVVEEVVNTVARGINPLGRQDDKPVASFIFAGTTGVGKTYLSELLARELKDYSYKRIDMSEFSEKHTIARLIGAPQGYVGMGESQLEQILDKNLKTVLVFDEIEKAHLDVLNILLQILDTGKASTATGKDLDFTQTIIICTTNVGADAVYQSQKTIGFGNKDAKGVETNQEVVRKALEKFFRTEWLNRFSKILVFNTVTIEAIRKIIINKYIKLRSDYRQGNMVVTVSDNAISALSKIGFNPTFGVRELERVWDDTVAGSILDYYDYSTAQKQILVDSNYTAEQIEQQDDRDALKASLFTSLMVYDDSDDQ